MIKTAVSVGGLRRLPGGVKIALLVAGSLGVAIAELSSAPYPQDPSYHMFADTRAWLGVPFAGNVFSNLGFAIVGLLGLAFVLGSRGSSLLCAPRQSWPYITFFTGAVLIGMGSTYYHAAPVNETLFWDRLPMSLAFMALFAAFIADRIDARAGAVVALPLLVALGFAGVLHWHLTESAGHGDLRFYFLVQLIPVVAVPLICLLFEGRITTGRHVLYIIGWYAAALGCEKLDHEIYQALGRVMSGHTIKHLLAAIAIYVVLAMLRAGYGESRQRRT
ncbi:MAG: ceramidase domain-containing protein [Alphaproteobacteria bacterium]|nr:ceramidase domain-containing protein [Alphaproteobacteria bacterium]MDP6517060.1 ceramidase domain-containing protein [Alphaproteobacteria bacterium]